MNDASGASPPEEAALPREQLGTRLKDLFAVPTKNVESAFELILGLIEEQASQIDGLKRAQAEALGDAARMRDLTREKEELTREKEELSVDLEALKKNHGELLTSHGETAQAVAGLRDEIEMLAHNCFGDGAEHQGDQVTTDEDALDESRAAQPIGPENTGPENVDGETHSKSEENAAPGRGTVGRMASSTTRVSVSLDADQTVAARLDRLEQSLSSSAKRRSSSRQASGPSPETKPADETLEEISTRIQAVENILYGFEPPTKGGELQQQEEAKGDGSEHPVVESTASDPEQNDGMDQDDSVEEVEATPETRQLTSHPRFEAIPETRQPTSRGRHLTSRGSLLLHLNERDMRTGVTIDDLAQQMSDLREIVQCSSLQRGDPGEVQKQFAELSSGLQKQLAELEVSVGDKVSGEDFETKIRDMHVIISSYNAAETADVSPDLQASTNDEPVVADVSPTLQASTNDELVVAKRHIMEQVSKLESTKLDKDEFEQQLDQMECDLKSFFEQELLKQQLDISDHAEKTENDLMDIRSIIDSQNDTVLHLRDEIPMSSDVDVSMKEDEIIARIQQATDDVRESLEERLDKLSSIESEVDGFASKMAEKPSQDQIESMLDNLEKRLGKDEALQILLGNMKIELKQRMTRGEVMTLVKHNLNEAKLGIENTQDTLMVGRIAYCLGCNKPCPAGVNKTRASKMNHDSLPPALGLVSNATLYGAGHRKNLRPLQMLRSAPPPRPRPKSAILGKFSASSAYVRVRNKSR